MELVTQAELSAAWARDNLAFAEVMAVDTRERSREADVAVAAGRKLLVELLASFFLYLLANTASFFLYLPQIQSFLKTIRLSFFVKNLIFYFFMIFWQIYKMGQEQFDKEFKFVEDFGIHNIAEEIIIQARESAQVEVVRVEDRESEEGFTRKPPPSLYFLFFSFFIICKLS